MNDELKDCLNHDSYDFYDYHDFLFFQPGVFFIQYSSIKKNIRLSYNPYTLSGLKHFCELLTISFCFTPKKT